MLLITGAALLSALPVVALRWIDPPTTAFILADDSGHPVRHHWTPWRELGTHLVLAVVAAEDQKFLDHRGFDLDSIAQAIQDQRARGGPLRGASTISQQVAKNLFLWPGRSLLRKGIEAWYTALIEVLWSKRRILEIYLNVAEFGPGVYGAGAASQAFFNTVPAGLSRQQAALMAAVLPSPKRYSAVAPGDYLHQRQTWILDHMGRLQRSGWEDRLHYSEASAKGRMP